MYYPLAETIIAHEVFQTAAWLHKVKEVLERLFPLQVKFGIIHHHVLTHFECDKEIEDLCLTL